MMMSVTIASEAMLLCADKALYWPRESCLFIADIHFGKVAAFRAAGMPLPPGSTTAALLRLDKLIANTGATRIVFLGDFLHSLRARASPTMDAFYRWRLTHRNIKITLVRGNHDKHAGDPPAGWHIETIDEGSVLGPFCLAHHPEPNAAGYVLAGHIHPAIRLKGAGKDTLRLACFWVGEQVMVLPAFGEFTGTYVIKPSVKDRVFVAADEQLFEVKAG